MPDCPSNTNITLAFLPRHLYFYIFDWPNIVLDIFALFEEVWQLFTGFFLFFKGLHFVAKGFKNSCSRNFFYKVFFSFYTPTHVTSRQSGGEGWWVVNSLYLSVNTTPKNTLLTFTPYYLSFSSLICFYFIWFVHGAEYVAEVVNSEGW